MSETRPTTDTDNVITKSFGRMKGRVLQDHEFSKLDDTAVQLQNS